MDPLPSENELTALNTELCILLMIYTLTLFFAIYNIMMYLVKQKRYSTWLVTLFYVLSVIILVTRFAQYCVEIKFNNFMRGKTPNSPALSQFIHYPRKMATCQTLADYSNFSLGFVQLASLCELAIVLRFSIYHRKH